MKIKSIVSLETPLFAFELCFSLLLYRNTSHGSGCCIWNFYLEYLIRICAINGMVWKWRGHGKSVWHPNWIFVEWALFIYLLFPITLFCLSYSVVICYSCVIAHVNRICKYANVISCKSFIFEDDSDLNRNVEFRFGCVFVIMFYSHNESIRNNLYFSYSLRLLTD